MRVCAIKEGKSCEAWVDLIQSGFTIIYAAAGSTSSAIPEKLPPTKRDVDHDAVATWWEQTLGASGLSFDSIDAEPLDASHATVISRRDGEPQLLARVRFTGLLDAETGTKHNIVANHYEGNNTVLHLPMGGRESAMSAAAAAGGASGLTTGSDPGFKISYTTRQTSGLRSDDQQEMARYLAMRWAELTETYRNMDDCMGLAKTHHDSNFYFRIIPELKEFDLEYESVDVCGGTKKFL